MPSGCELLLDDDLRGDAGVIGADLPQRVVAEHAVLANQRVHHRLLERVAHVQGAGDVRRRKLDRKRGLSGSDRRRSSRAIPKAAPSALRSLLGSKLFCQIARRRIR